MGTLVTPSIPMDDLFDIGTSMFPVVVNTDAMEERKLDIYSSWVQCELCSEIG
jgi:hypothetical protein